MGKIRRGNFFFISWTGDHGHHVHVYRGGELVVKWDIDNWRAMKGRASKRVIKLLEQLMSEDLL